MAQEDEGPSFGKGYPLTEQLQETFSRQDAKRAKKKIFLISPNLAPFVPLQLALWNSAPGKQLDLG